MGLPAEPLPVVELRPSFDRADMLRNAPHADGEFYLVPAVLGE